MKNTATTSAHTPGPWVLAPNGEIKARAWVGKWDDYICRMPFGSAEEAAEIGPSQIANASLIAAAPELLEACERMKAAIDDMLNDDSLGITSDCGDLLVQIASMPSDTIARATGTTAC